jgi:lipoprotein-anchoring transpeptidase ErfK/SrfK
VNKKAIVIVVAAAAACVLLGLGIRSCSSSRPSGVKGAAQPGAQALLSQEKGLEAEGKLLEAKAVYQKLVFDFPNHKDVAQWQRGAEQISMKILFSAVMTPQCVQYEIKPGDSLEKIAREYKTTVELIKKSNGIQEDRIYPGMKVRVWNAPFAVLVDKSSNILLLKCNEEVLKTYTVSTGKNNCTPVGTFKIIEKIVNPPWYKDGKVIPPTSPENILGTRWMGIEKEGYGIHGTTEPQSLGKQATAGCVRMENKDVEELYSIVPQGTVVTIVD